LVWLPSHRWPGRNPMRQKTTWRHGSRRCVS